MKKIIVISFLVIYTINSFAQKNNYSLAFSYYNEKAYDKAAVVFKKIYNNTQNEFYFRYYILSLTKSGNTKEAKKSLKKKLRRQKNYPPYIALLGFAYEQEGDTTKAIEYYDKSVNVLPPSVQQINLLAGLFNQLSKYEYATKCFLKGRKLTDYAFNRELGSMYALSRDYKNMSKYYLDWVDEDHNNSETLKMIVKNYLKLDVNDEFYNAFKIELIKKAQERNKSVFDDMLIWLFLQKRDYYNAFLQARSFVKRYKTHGRRIIEVANAALKDKKYQVAYDAYKFVANMGEDKMYYFEAKAGMTNVVFEQISNNDIVDSSKIIEVEKQFIDLLEKFGYTKKTYKLAAELAHLQAFYLNKTEEAIKNINKALSIRELRNKDKGFLMILLGDVQMFENKIWEANLTYSRAENINKNNETGSKAKLHKAKLAYYTGDFEWAMAQLDAIRGSTSKLISNDAISLYDFIKDNIKDDSTHQALKIYAHAELALYRKKADLALTLLDSLIKKYPNHQVTDDAFMKEADIYKQKKNYFKAVNLYAKVINTMDNNLKDRALFEAAVIYETKLYNKQKAMELYKEILRLYPDSIYAIHARKRFRKLRGDNS